VISAVDESVDATRCQGKGGCQGGDKCLTHALWRDLSDRLTGFLNNITLGELVNNQEILDVSGRQHRTNPIAPAVRTHRRQAARIIYPSCFALLRPHVKH
jgi:Rrf2 family iron-sulfur cluster assembly transcriptional regulator